MNLENKALKSYQYAIVVGCAIFFGTLTSYFLIISPLYKNTQKAGIELAAKEQKYDSLVAKKAKLDELKDKETELKKQATIVSNALPKEEEIGRMFIQLDSLVRASNGTLKSVSKSGVGTSAADANLSSTGISKTVYNLPLDLPTYFDLKNFIVDAGAALRLISLDNLTISASPSGTMTVNVTANSYTRK